MDSMNQMKKTSYALVPFAVFIAAVCLGAPQARIESPTHDFGRIDRLSKVKHVFIVKNAGTSNLVIKKIEAG